ETPFGQGVSLIRQQLLDVLARHGLEPLAAQGKPFDPQTMEAGAVDAATDNVPAGHVSAGLRRGYKLNGNVVRPGQVDGAKSSEHGCSRPRRVDSVSGKEARPWARLSALTWERLTRS